MCKCVFLVFLLFSFIFVVQSKEDDGIVMRPMQQAARADLSVPSVRNDICLWQESTEEARLQLGGIHAGSLVSNDVLAVINLHHLAGKRSSYSYSIGQ